MEISERGLQRKQLNADYKRILNERAPSLSSLSLKEVCTRLEDLSRELCQVYLSYPLLCGRFSEQEEHGSDEDAEDMVNASDVETNAQAAGSPVHGQPRFKTAIVDVECESCETQRPNSEATESGDAVVKTAKERVNANAKRKGGSRKQKHNPIKQQLRYAGRPACRNSTTSY